MTIKSSSQLRDYTECRWLFAINFKPQISKTNMSLLQFTNVNPDFGCAKPINILFADNGGSCASKTRLKRTGETIEG